MMTNIKAFNHATHEHYRQRSLAHKATDQLFDPGFGLKGLRSH